MEIIGVVAEYNPFHNGHLYQINQIKKEYPNSIIILVLNGYFLQRGEISLISKENKTKIALNNNIDIVLELPFIWGSQSADYFANASIYLLNKLKANIVIFGSESNNIKLLSNIALKQQKKEYQSLVKTTLSSGINYPTALAKSLQIKENINQPNDLLGISYIKAINKINKNITPISIKRTNNYHDLEKNEKIISASNIRNKLLLKEKIDNYIPKYPKSYFEKIDYQKLFDLLKFKVLTSHNLKDYLTVDEGIENRLLKYIAVSENLEELTNNIKTKRYTYNKINRMYFHILIGLTKKDRNSITNPEYIKILGFNQKGKKYLNSLKKINQNYKKTITYDYELKAQYLYSLIVNKEIMFDTINKPIKK